MFSNAMYPRVNVKSTASTVARLGATLEGIAGANRRVSGDEIRQDDLKAPRHNIRTRLFWDVYADARAAEGTRYAPSVASMEKVLQIAQKDLEAQADSKGEVSPAALARMPRVPVFVAYLTSMGSGIDPK